jgi:charged multivesicular body protein 5
MATDYSFSTPLYITSHYITSHQALGRSFGVPDDIDEDELDAELACLGDEFEEEFAEEIPNPSYMQESGMPHVPAGGPPLTERPQEVRVDASVDEFGLPVQNVA